MGGRAYGRLVLPSPAALYANALHETPWEFRKNAIYFAGQHFARNARTIAIKGWCADVVTAGLALEVLWFALWIAR